MSEYSSLFNSTSFSGDYIDVGEINSESLSLSAATNQLTLGNTTISDVEIIPRTGTIPDTGGESFEFVITANNIDQIIGGITSFVGGIKVDDINEYTVNNGVTIESINIKDGNIVPTIDNSYNIGSSSYGFLNAWLSYIRANNIETDTLQARTGSNITSNSSIVPLANNIFDLGAALQKFANIYTQNVLVGSCGTGIGHFDASGNLTSSLIVNADISASAGIVDTKLATISSAGKVSNSATTATASNVINTIVARDGSGNISAGLNGGILSGVSFDLSTQYYMTLKKETSAIGDLQTYVSLYYDTTTGKVYSPTIVANIEGSVTGSASAVTITDTSLNGSYYLAFTLGPTSSAVYSNTGVRVNPSTATITASLNGNSSTSTLATTASNITLANDSANATNYLLFSNTATGNQPIKTVSNISCNPSNSTITATNFAGTSTNTTKIAINGNSGSSTNYLFYTPTNSGNQSVYTANSTLTYDEITDTLLVANLNGTAARSTQSVLVNGTGTTNYISFSTGLTGAQNMRTNSGLLYNGTTNTVTATTFNGNATSATNATNLTGSGTISATSTATTAAINTNSTIVATTAYADRQFNLFRSLPTDILIGSGNCTNGITAGTYRVANGGNTNMVTFASTASLIQPAIIQIDSADFPVLNGVTGLLRLRVNFSNNNTAYGAGNSFTFGLYPVNACGSGTAATISYTVGAVVTGSTVVFTNPTVSAVTNTTSATFAIPTNGTYALGVVLSATTPATWGSNHTCRLQLVYP